MVVSVVMYKTMGISNTAIAFWTSILYLPWVIKPIWSPFVDIKSTKRNWIVIMQLLLASAFVALALIIQLPRFFPISIAILSVMAFLSATHDIAADGFYMLGLNRHHQAWFVGIRSTFYRVAMITGQGLIVMLAGYIQSQTGLEPVYLDVEAVPESQVVETANIKKSDIEQEDELRIFIHPRKVVIPIPENSETIDSVDVFIALSAPPERDKPVVVNFGRDRGSKDIFMTSAGRFEFTRDNWNKPVKVTLRINQKLKTCAFAQFKATAGNIPFSWFVVLVITGVAFFAFGLYHRFILPYPKEEMMGKAKDIWRSSIEVFTSFFKKRGIVASIAFLLLYRFAESQLVKLASPFLLDSQEAGGLALTTTQLGFAYGTVGVISLTLGGILGGFLAAHSGLKRWIWFMVIAINVPDVAYVYLSHWLPYNFLIVTFCVAIEQFGYGFGFTGYMLYQIYISEGKYRTAHYAITTGFMALGMMLPGIISGKIQEMIGYQNFFVWILICTIPSFLAVRFIKIDPSFGKKER